MNLMSPGVARICSAVSCAMLGSLTPLEGQGAVTGVVRQDSSRLPLAGVEVLIEKPKRQTVSDAAGRFGFASVPKGDRVVLFRAVGYRPVRHLVRVTETDTAQADALLVPFAVPLEPIKVTAPAPSASMLGLEGYEARRARGWGEFIDSTELRRAEGLRLPDLLRHHAKIRFVTAGREIRAASKRYSATNGVPCYMQIYLDGMSLFKPISPSSYLGVFRAEEKMPAPPDLRTEFEMASLDGVEIYEGAGQTPPEFDGPGAACGTIAMWTRKRK